jgi:hypothetical protein
VAPPATTAAATVEKPRAVAADPGPATVASVEPVSSNPPAVTPATPLMASKSMMAPPDPAAGKLIEPAAPEVVASVPPADNPEPDAAEETSPRLAVQRTEFAVDIGAANSLGGLRMLWQSLVKSNAPLATLRPVVAVKEGNHGLGLQLRLVAGPLSDAAAAAKICAALIEGKRTCETTVFDGQRLAMKADEPPASIKPAPVKPAGYKRSAGKPAANADSAKKPESSTLSAFFGKRN